ncbi:uncharacterized protein LOC144546167 [Carex rostrata]
MIEEDQNYDCMRELGAEILMFITSLIFIVLSAASLWGTGFTPTFIRGKRMTEKSLGLILSSVYSLFLPLMSFMFAQAKQYSSEGRSQQILIWMVLIEFVRLCGDPFFTWKLQKSAEQLVRLFWVGFLVYSYAPLHGIRISLFILCIFFAIVEVLKGIAFNKAKDSYLIGKNPKLIHNYVKRVVVENGLRTTPLSSCNYIVMGENYNEIDVCCNGYLLGKQKSNSKLGMVTVSRVFELTNSSEDDPHHWHAHFCNWRDTCLSFALAKMLRRRFAKLPVDEAGCGKALDFVLKGLIDDIGNGDDDVEITKPMERVFRIIQQELDYVSDFYHMRVPAYNYNLWYVIVDIIGIIIITGIGMSLVLYPTFWKHELDGYSCLFGPVVKKILPRLDIAITDLLVIACLYVQYAMLIAFVGSNHWETVKSIERYIRDPDKWKQSNRSLETSIFSKVFKTETLENKNAKKPISTLSVFDEHAETLLFCVKVDLSILAHLPKWIRKKVPRSFPAEIYRYVTKEAVLKSLRNSGGSLTNGETSLKKYNMERLNWACHPNGSPTEAILIWHIATTLFHHQGQESSPQQIHDPHQEPAVPQQNNKPLTKEKEVALELSTYCHYLVAYRRELLPDEVEWTEKMYESVRKDILAIVRSFDKKTTKNDRCNYALQTTTWGENSLVGKGAKLANDLINCAKEGFHVWEMLAEFWPEMMLFIVPSDNVKGHRKILHKKEFITQLWALLTHAGIVTRPTPTAPAMHQNHEGESNAVSGDEINAIPGEEINAIPGDKNV